MPDDIAFGTKDLTKDQVVSQLIEVNRVVDHAYNLMWFFLYWWIGTTCVNLILLVCANELHKPTIAPRVAKTE